MSQFDKMVKMACKPKNAPPKPKYVDPLVAATFSDDGSLQDITRSLSLRLREPNAVVVFKALLVLHMMIRTGNTENLLSSLSSGGGDPLRLKNIANSGPDQNWEGFSPPSNMGMYAIYLDVRIRAFKDLKHDFVRTQAESNRRSDGLGANSKARRLRHLAVDKGLLREVKAIQKMLDALVVCRFYEDNLQDENTVIAFRMLIKDLLVLFQAGNEGVCNILEHYFEMSKPDATESFDIYKSFIKQTDRVVDYLSMARKLHNVVNIPVPNLKHAPTGLVKALEEYLNDPDFEGNRVEYRRSLGIVEGRAGRDPSPTKPASTNTPAKPTPAPTSQPSASASTSTSAPPAQQQKIQDFFDSIQSDSQPTMFGGQPSNGFAQSPPMQQQPQFPFMQQQPQQQPQFNPFRQSMMMPQQTGFVQPQMTGYPMGGGMGGGFMQPQMTGQMAFGNMQQSPFPQQPQQQQQTQFAQPQPQSIQSQQTGFLQPQQTGSNPFRQSMMMGANPTGGIGGFGGMGQFGAGGAGISQPTTPFGSIGNGNSSSGAFGPTSPITRPGSTPVFSPTGAQKPLVAQATGSRNPFAPAGGVPAMPQKQERGPSMNELAASRFNSMNQQGQGQMNGGSGGGGGGMADVASSFAFDSTAGAGAKSGGPTDFMSQFGSLSVNTSSNSGVGASNTGTSTSSPFGKFTNPTSVSSAPTSPGGQGQFLQPQKTGFGGSAIKPFKPSSSFGSQLMADLGSMPEVGSPGGSAFAMGSTSPSGAGAGGAQGSAQFGQMSPQLTGGGSNPFRASGFGSLGPQSTGIGGMGMGMQGTGAGAGGAGGGGGFGQGAFGSTSPFAGRDRGGGQFGQMQGQGQGQFGQGAGQGQGGSLI